eukprot:3346779-Rhodomonas_salina.1
MRQQTEESTISGALAPGMQFLVLGFESCPSAPPHANSQGRTTHENPQRPAEQRATRSVADEVEKRTLRKKAQENTSSVLLAVSCVHGALWGFAFDFRGSSWGFEPAHRCPCSLAPAALAFQPPALSSPLLLPVPKAYPKRPKAYQKRTQSVPAYAASVLRAV